MAIENKMAKKASPFLVEGTPKKKSAARPKPASGLVACLQEARYANREADEELRAMAARIAALQEAEAMADTRIQKVKGKVDKIQILSERSASNKVDYVCADGDAKGSRKGGDRAARGDGAAPRRTGSGGSGRAPSTPRRPEESGDSRAATSKGKKAPLQRSASTGRAEKGTVPKDTLRRGTALPDGHHTGDKHGRSASVDRRRSNGAPAAPPRSERPPSGENAKITKGGKPPQPGRPAVQGSRSAQPRSISRSHSASSSLDGDDTVRYQFEDRPENGGAKAPSGQEWNGAEGGTYIHPAFLDNDSSDDDDDGPTLAEALMDPSLRCMTVPEETEGALDGLLDRYADNAEQPLQAVIDGAALEAKWAEDEAARLLSSREATAKGDVEGSCVVVELGAGAWG